MIDLLLLKSTFLITGKSVKNFRLTLSSLFASVFSLIFPLINLPNSLLILLKVLLGILILVVACTFSSKKEVYIHLVVFISLTMFSGGGIYFIYNFLGVNLNSELVVATIFIPSFLLLRVVKGVINFVYRRKNIENSSFFVRLSIDGNKIVVKGFLDTGNNVYYQDAPVIICSKKVVSEFFNDESFYNRIKEIEILTVNGKSKNHVIKLDSFEVLTKGYDNIYNNVWVMISSQKSFGTDLIIHPDLINKKEMEDASHYKKVS
jgi:hypothetical protein